MSLEDQLRVIVARNQQARDAENGRVSGLLSAIQSGVQYEFDGRNAESTGEVLGQAGEDQAMVRSDREPEPTETRPAAGEESGG